MLYLELGAVPGDEKQAQVGQENFRSEAYAECQRYMKALESYFGTPPQGAHFTIKWFEHELGNYPEVIIRYNDSNPEAISFAFLVENNAPGTWRELEGGVFDPIEAAFNQMEKALGDYKRGRITLQDFAASLLNSVEKIHNKAFPPPSQEESNQTRYEADYLKLDESLRKDGLRLGEEANNLLKRLHDIEF